MGQVRQPGIVAARLDADTLSTNFADLHDPLSPHEALVAADRCYFCYDAPCIAACPTSIDIPLFIRQIAAGQPASAAHTIFDQNILGGMCARVCPTETLCEEACVREKAEGKPVLIGQLQRFATDSTMDSPHPYKRGEATGKRVAIVGAGPAGLACAHRLAVHGHSVTIFDARPKGGGLNEYGIAAYKTVDGFAQAELDWLLSIGGIEMETGRALGTDLTLTALLGEHDGVFLGIGLGGVNALGLGAAAVSFIAELRQVDDFATMPVGRNVVIIGGGMTAIDAAVQSRLLGAETVTLVYRRGQDRMAASRFEQDLATSKGVRIIFHAQPKGQDGQTITFEYTEATADGLHGTGETFSLDADQIWEATGQTLDGAPAELELEAGRIRVGESGETSLARVWAGGDCATGGDDLTVTAVAEGRDAAESIHRMLDS